MHFVNLRDAGDPVAHARFYQEEGADELAMLDKAAKITIAIDSRRNKGMLYSSELIIAGRTKPMGKDAVTWAYICAEMGAGTILPMSRDDNRTLSDDDLEFTSDFTGCLNLSFPDYPHSGSNGVPPLSRTASDLITNLTSLRHGSL